MVRGPKARALAAALRQLRKDSGVLLVDLAAKAGMSKSVLDRIERNLRVVSEVEVARLIGALEVSGSQVDAVLRLAAEANSPNWLATGAGVSLQVATLAEYESSAEKIWTVTTVVVPGLLQTEAYARAVFAGGGVLPRDVSTQVLVRLQRQTVLTRDSPVTLVAIIDEPAIRRVVGSREITIAQLRHIVTMAERPNVTVRVIPYGIGAHRATSGSYELIELAGQAPVVHAENMHGGVFLDQEMETLDMRDRTDRLRQSALSPAESTGLIDDALANLERT